MAKKSKKRKNDIRDLNRPIIFICNDSYARALRPLKELCLDIKISEAEPDRLIRRLRHICRQESVKIEDSILKGIAKESKNDVRSSINSLQFIASMQKNLDSIDMQKVS